MVCMVTASDVKKVIEDKDLKIKGVAVLIGVEPDTLGKWLSGKGGLGKPARLLLGHVLGLQPVKVVFSEAS